MDKAVDMDAVMAKVRASNARRAARRDAMLMMGDPTPITHRPELPGFSSFAIDNPAVHFGQAGLPIPEGHGES